jgi:predicted Zn finger-like uncharacterized protein
MSEKLRTQCPFCSTKFNITKKILTQAGGQVRCGSCSEVFNAAEQLVNLEKAKAAAPKKSFMNKLSEGMSSSKKKTQVPKPKSSEPVDESWAEDLLNDLGEENSGKPATKKPIKSAKQDESWADDMLKDLENASASVDAPDPEPEQLLVSGLVNPEKPVKESNSKKLKAEKIEDQLSDSFKNLGEFQNDDPFAIDADALDDTIGASSRAPEEPEMDFEEPQLTRQKSNQSAQDFLSNQAPLDHEAETEQSSGGNLDFDSLNSVPFDASAVPELDQDLSVLSDRSERSSFFIREFKWIAGSIGLLLLLGIQTAIFQFDTLAKNSSMRGFYEIACGAVGCELPLKTDLKKIKIKKALVDHKTEKGAVSIKLQMDNQAKFNQPFPKIQITFADINGIPLAKRTFKSAEYLKQTDLKHLPNNKKVQFSINIQNPGEDAHNYNIKLLKSDR